MPAGAFFAWHKLLPPRTLKVIRLSSWKATVSQVCLPKNARAKRNTKNDCLCTSLRKGMLALFVDRSPWKEAAWKKRFKNRKKSEREGNQKGWLSLYIFEKKGYWHLFVDRSPWKGSLKNGSKTEKEWAWMEPERSQRVPKSRAKTATQAKRLRHQQIGGNSVGNFGNSQKWCHMNTSSN